MQKEITENRDKNGRWRKKLIQSLSERLEGVQTIVHFKENRKINVRYDTKFN